MDGRQELKLKTRTLQPTPETQGIAWQSMPKKLMGESLMKNMAVAASLVICAVALHSGAVPPLDKTTDAVLAAASGDTLLDENLGKLSFVSSMFPEATLVFGEQQETLWSMPVTAEKVVHAWSEQEPYVGWQTKQRYVQAAVDGEVTAVFHGNGDERVIQVMSEDGITCLYGNLATCEVTTGDAVKMGDTLGILMEDAACVLEVRRNGYSVDPASVLP